MWPVLLAYLGKQAFLLKNQNWSVPEATMHGLFVPAKGLHCSQTQVNDGWEPFRRNSQQSCPVTGGCPLATQYQLVHVVTVTIHPSTTCSSNNYQMLLFVTPSVQLPQLNLSFESGLGILRVLAFYLWVDELLTCAHDQCLALDEL